MRLLRVKGLAGLHLAPSCCSERPRWGGKPRKLQVSPSAGALAQAFAFFPSVRKGQDVGLLPLRLCAPRYCLNTGWLRVPAVLRPPAVLAGRRGSFGILEPTTAPDGGAGEDASLRRPPDSRP